MFALRVSLIGSLVSNALAVYCAALTDDRFVYGFAGFTLGMTVVIAVLCFFEQ